MEIGAMQKEQNKKNVYLTIDRWIFYIFSNLSVLYKFYQCIAK